MPYAGMSDMTDVDDVVASTRKQDADARHKAGHDEVGDMRLRCRKRGEGADRASRYGLARVSASQMPPPIMKEPEMRDTSRVRRAENSVRARPASSA